MKEMPPSKKGNHEVLLAWLVDEFLMYSARIQYGNEGISTLGVISAYIWKRWKAAIPATLLKLWAC